MRGVRDGGTGLGTDAKEERKEGRKESNVKGAR